MDVILFVREAFERLPQLRSDMLNNLLSNFSAIKAARVRAWPLCVCVCVCVCVCMRLRHFCLPLSFPLMCECVSIFSRSQLLFFCLSFLLLRFVTQVSRATLWIIGEYAVSAADILAAMKEIKFVHLRSHPHHSLNYYVFV